MKVCKGCGRLLPYEMFYSDKRVKDGCQSRCKECVLKDRKLNRKHHTELQRKSYRKGKEYINLCKTPCAKCGCAKPYVLEFHHINPADKKFNIGINRYSKNSVDEELKKCVCLCCNCHHTYHYFYGMKPDKPVETLEEYLKSDWTPPVKN